jgi:Spy/CpxP family protein refolding chaperone
VTRDDVSAGARLPEPSNRIAVVTLLLVFLGGAATGAVVMRWREHQMHLPAPAVSRLPFTVDDWKKKLDLTEDQTRQITSILDDFSLLYDNVLADGNTRIMQVLNPEQKQRFQQMLSERRR